MCLFEFFNHALKNNFHFWLSAVACLKTGDHSKCLKEDDNQEPSEISPSALQIKENIARMREVEELEEEDEDELQLEFHRFCQISEEF